jgi:hypothetical protein
MPYWNEMPGAGEPSPLNRSRRKAMKHSLLLGPIICAPWAIEVSKPYSGDPLTFFMNVFAGIFVAGPFFGLIVLSPFLGWFYQWRLIRYREKNGISHPGAHSYHGDKWLELDEDDPVRREVEDRLRR